MKSKQIQQKGSSKFVRLLKKILLNKQIYLMLIPVLIFYIIYCYVPMGGIVLAWKSYKRKLGIYASPWVGWENFELLFEMPQFGSAVKNTVVISLLNIVFCFPMPIIFALLLNEILHKTFKKSVQTMTYLPHFISWVIIGGLAKMALAYDGGVINNIVEAFGGERVSWLTHEKYFYPILIILTIWKDTGWGSIIYIAAISGIDTSLYEAARIDGCTRFGCIWRITVPCILPTIAVMLIMKIANIMNAGFDPVYNLYNKTIYGVADILDTLSYRLFTEDSQMELTAALGLFKTSINVVFLVIGNFATKKLTGYSMYSFD